MEPTTANDSLIDIIQNNSVVTATTVAEAKSRTKSSRQVNLTTILAQLSEFGDEEIMSYPINTILGIKAQGNRIATIYAKGVKVLNELN